MKTERGGGVLFFGGLPTRPDTEKIMRLVEGRMTGGASVTYAEIEKATTIQRGSQRWGSVIAAWKKRMLREHNIVVEADPGKGFAFLAPGQRVEFAGRRFRHGVRRIFSAAEIAARTDRSALTADQARACESIERGGATARLALATEAKRLTFRVPESTSGEKR